jgi:Polycystin cation channel
VGGSYSGLNTFVIGLLYLRILSFLNVVNKEMSTFITALWRILKKLVYFTIVLVVVILMFGDVSSERFGHRLLKRLHCLLLLNLLEKSKC